MNESNVRLLMSLMGCKVGTRSPKGWLRGSCPFAPWLHSKGKDVRPSFAVKVEENDASHFKCYSCGVHGSLKQLVWRYEREIGKEVPELESLVMRADTVSLKALRERVANSSFWFDAKAVASSSSTPDHPPPLMQSVEDVLAGRGGDSVPEEHLDRFKGRFSSDALSYLKSDPPEGRKLSDETIAAWELGYHSGSHRVVIPVRDWKGRLVCLSGRDVLKYPACPRCGTAIPKGDSRCPSCEWRKPPKFLHALDFKRDWYLFGENKLNPSLRRGILVEGFFDVIDLWQRGYENVIADMGSYLSVVQMEKLFRWFDRVFVIPDGDPEGRAAAGRIQSVLSNRLKTFVVDGVPEGKDPDQLSDSFLEAAIGPPTRLGKTA